NCIATALPTLPGAFPTPRAVFLWMGYAPRRVLHDWKVLRSGWPSPLSREPPEPCLVEQDDPMPLFAKPLDFHQLQAGVAARRLLDVGPAADPHRCERRRATVDERAGA